MTLSRLFLNFINVDMESKEKTHSTIAATEAVRMLGIIFFGYYQNSLTILVKRISVIRADNKEFLSGCHKPVSTPTAIVLKSRTMS